MIIKTFVIIEDKGSFLLIREAAKKWKGKWFLPGGKVDPGESLTEAAKREVKEEAGYEINITGVAYIRSQERILEDQLSVFYCGEVKSGVLKTRPDRHSLEAKWFPLDKIRTLPLRQKLLQVLNRYQPQHLLPAENFVRYP